MSINFRNRAIAMVCVAVGVPVTAQAQWSETNLSPGSTFARAWGASGTQQVGFRSNYNYNGEQPVAGVWSGTAASFVNLNPAGASGSFASGASGNQQVGDAVINNEYVAALWSGTAASFVNLNPAGASASNATAISGTQQVGYAQFGQQEVAGLWSGTAASFVNLNPAGATYSVANGTTGSQQVGNADIGGQSVAGLWNGTAASFVNLNPSGSTESFAFADWDGSQSGSGSAGILQQVGEAFFGGEANAGMWFGTAASFVNLNPAGSTSSVAFGEADGKQVGFATFGGQIVAGYWSGTAASWVALPDQSDWSEAWGISVVGNTTYITGYSNGGETAVLWTSPAVPEPAPIVALGVGALGFMLRKRRRR